MSESIIDGDVENDTTPLLEITPENIAKVRKVAKRKRKWCQWFGCPHPHHAKGWCIKHYLQDRRGNGMWSWKKSRG